MGKRLLVVDSDRRFIQDHKSPLESAFEVDFLYATEGALTRLESGTYGAILLCVETSENKGYALCSAIRRAPAFADLKIALISAKASEEEYARHRLTKGKADLYLHKPINATALIPALAAFVPMKEDDPDNPLGDLAGTDLGDEWLESLRTELETEPPPPPRTISPAPGWAAEPLPERTAEKFMRNQGEVELLEWRVKDLELKLAAQHDELERRNRDIDDLHHRCVSVTRNLDEAQQFQEEAEQLRLKVQAMAEAEDRLRGDLQDALDEQKRLVDQVEEKDQHGAELMDSVQLLQAQVEEAREAADRIRQLEEQLSQTQEALRTAEARADLAEQRRSDLEAEQDGFRTGLADAAARIQELEGGVGRVQELEAELTSAREQVDFQEHALRSLAEEKAGLQAARDRQDEVMTEQAGELIVLQEKLALQETTARDAAQERDALLESKAQLEQHSAGLQGQLEAALAASEEHKRDFLAGIEEREAALGRLNASLEAQGQRIAQLEAERDDLAALAQGRTDRLQAITTVLTELEGKARQALDLAKAVTD